MQRDNWLFLSTANFFLLVIFLYGKVHLDNLRSCCLLLFSSNVHSFSFHSPPYLFLQRKNRPNFLFIVFCIYRRKNEKIFRCLFCFYFTCVCITMVWATFFPPYLLLSEMSFKVALHEDINWIVDNFSGKECLILKISLMELSSLWRTETFEIKWTHKNILLITSRL